MSIYDEQREFEEKTNSDINPSNQEINEALQGLIARGLIEYGVNEDGEFVFWTTEAGKEAAKKR